MTYIYCKCDRASFIWMKLVMKVGHPKLTHRQRKCFLKYLDSLVFVYNRKTFDVGILLTKSHNLSRNSVKHVPQQAQNIILKTPHNKNIIAWPRQLSIPYFIFVFTNTVTSGIHNCEKYYA